MDIGELKPLVAHIEGQREDRLKTWRELSALMLPSRGVYSGEDRNNLRNRRLFNNAAARALSKAAAGLTEAMTPSSLEWFQHDFIDQQQREATGARQFVQALDERLRMVLSAGGFYQAIHAFNKEILCFGCALLYAESSQKTMVRYSCPTNGTYAVALNNDNEISCVVHRAQYTAKELCASFGDNKVSEVTRGKLKTRSYELIDVVHVVMERMERDVDKADSKNMPYASYWYEDAHGTGLLRESGYKEMPYMFSRWDDGRGVYGTGPGDEALSDQKAIESYELRKAVGLEKLIDPPTITTGALGDRLDTRAGASNAVAGTGGQQIGPLYQINFGPAFQAVQQEVMNISQRIDETMKASIFAGMSLDQRPAGMTATEYMDHRRRAAQMMGPAVSAYEPNVLNRVIDRTYGILDRAGLTPLPPPSLQGFTLLDVQYMSPMAQMLRQTGAESTRALLVDALPLVQAMPETADKLDMDQVIDELARGLSAPGSVVRSDEDVAKMREARAQAQAQQQQLAEQMAMLQQATQVGNVSTKDTVAGEALRQ